MPDMAQLGLAVDELNWHLMLSGSRYLGYETHSQRPIGKSLSRDV